MRHNRRLLFKSDSRVGLRPYLTDYQVGYAIPRWDKKLDKGSFCLRSYQSWKKLPVVKVAGYFLMVAYFQDKNFKSGMTYMFSLFIGRWSSLTFRSRCCCKVSWKSSNRGWFVLHDMAVSYSCTRQSPTGPWPTVLRWKPDVQAGNVGFQPYYTLPSSGIDQTKYL